MRLEHPFDGAGTCTDGMDYPRVLEDADPTMAVVQGYVVTDQETLDRVAPPVGESAVRVPRHLLIEQGRRLEANGLFAAAAASVFRLETLPEYLVPQEDERLRAFREGRPLPPRPTPWLALVARSVATGVRWQRVHVVEQPLSDYLRFALHAYQENAQVGEDIWIADRGIHPELAGLTRDFWLLDAGTPAAAAILLYYSPEGRTEGIEISRDPDVLARCGRQRDLALTHGIPFTDFSARIDEQARLT